MPGRNDLTEVPMFMNGSLWKFWLSGEESAKLVEMDLNGARGRSLSPQVNFKYNGDLNDAKSKHYAEFMKYAAVEMQESARAWEANVYQARHGCHKEEGQIRGSGLSADDSFMDLKNYGDEGGKWNKFDYSTKIREDMEKCSGRGVNFMKKSEPFDKKERPDMARSLSYCTDRAESRSHAYRDHRSHSTYISSYKVCFIFSLHSHNFLKI